MKIYTTRDRQEKLRLVSLVAVVGGGAFLYRIFARNLSLASESHLL